MENISFIVPIYNVDISNLKYCIQSICNQNFKNYEIVLINDGSTNLEIEKICKNYTKSNKNIKYIKQKNQGSAVARNAGIEESTGKYIVFIDADDSLPNDYSKRLKKITNKSFDFLIFDYSYWGKHNEKIYSFNGDRNFINEKNDILANIMFYPDKMDNFMFGSIWGKIFNKDFLKKNNIKFLAQLRKAQDRMFMLEVINKSTNIFYYSQLMYRYRINDKSITHKLNYKMIEYYYMLFEAMKSFCKENNIHNECFKFLQYNIVNELVLLTVFHIDNKKKYKEIKKDYKKIYDKFDFKIALKNIQLKDIPSLKGKIKLILYKCNSVYFLNKFFRIQQKIKKRNLFKGKEV